MKKHFLLLTVAPFALVSPALASEATPAAPAQDEASDSSAPKAAEKEVFSTGVAKGRDVLDSAISTSSLKAEEVKELGARSLAEVLRNIPGVRAEALGGEGNNSYSIRGLPLAASGSKFLQFQEDGLPVLEFGDIQLMSSDVFMRVDSNLSQIEAIRGGSASTFASNSPGGVINLMSKTGDVEGGSIAATAGLNYGEYRLDFDYGGKLSDTLRYHIGGFYRQGEGPREVGYNAYKGGQIKFNITKQFGNGFVRLYGKYLDDKVPSYQVVPVKVTGTNDAPKYENLPGVDALRDSTLSRNITNLLLLDRNNVQSQDDARDGMHPVVKSLGLESQFDIAGFTVSEKFRYSDISGSIVQSFPLAVAPASALSYLYGGPGATLRYATGPNAGKAITSPSTLNGNGQLANTLLIDTKLNSLDNMTNDLRASRVWKIGGGSFTTTFGLYKSSQDFDTNWSFLNVLSDVRGGGESALVDVTTAGGVTTTQDGYIQYSIGSGAYKRRYDVNYDVTAPYGSVNYHIGKIAIGGSVRYDMGHVEGQLFGADLGGGRVGLTSYDFNGNGVISAAEAKTAILPLTQPGAVDYDYHYLSYSAGVNFRISEPLAVFARYSRGGRAAADRILFTGALNTAGDLIDPKDGYDTVKQTEVGVKFRKSGLALNVTGFSATTGERNLQVNSKPDGSVQVEHIVRGYSAKGAEFEGSYRTGPFSISAGATYTHAKISSDATNAALVGNTPRHQASFIYEVTPQFETRLFTVGANVVGQTSSYAQDTNKLKLPAYTLVNAFVQFRPVERVQLMLNANNLFDTLAIGEVTQGTIPASGIVLARAMTGRTVSGTISFAF